MTWKPRLIDPEELDAVIDLSAVMFTFGPRMPDPFPEQMKLVAEVDRIFVTDDGPTIAGTAAAYSLDVALPGGAAVPMCGVTEVGVLPTHRRRGMLSALMDSVLDQAIERGEPVAGLTASEGGIYRRFGYGVAARVHRVTVDRARSAETVDVSRPGRLRLITEDEAVTLLPAVWEQHWRRRAGEVDRSAAWWKHMAMDPEDARDGASARFLVAHEDADGTPDGFAIYRIKEGGAADGIYGELRVSDLAAADDEVEAVLLRYLLDVDLIGHIAYRAPLDLSLRWRLADPRAIKVTDERDWLWLRPLDVPRCLAARTYTGSGDGVVIDVVDEARPELGGQFRLEADGDGASCSPTTGEADVVVRAPELGALLLSGVTWRTLQRAGLVDESTFGAVDRLDAMFRPARAPYCGTGF